MTDYERYDRLREALAATPPTPNGQGGPAKAGWHHQDAAVAMADDWTQTHDLPALALWGVRSLPGCELQRCIGVSSRP
jgi:hypothetical protein